MNAILQPQVPRFAALTAARLPQVLQIERQAYSHPWTQGNFEDSMRAGYLIQVLLASEEVLGYFVAMHGADEVHLLNITVAPVHQGQGWARTMLDALAAWARTQDAQGLWLEVRESNARAIKVYRDHGFTRVGLRKDYYPAAGGAREHAVVMSRRL